MSYPRVSAAEGPVAAGARGEGAEDAAPFLAPAEAAPVPEPLRRDEAGLGPVWLSLVLGGQAEASAPTGSGLLTNQMGLGSHLCLAWSSSLQKLHLETESGCEGPEGLSKTQRAGALARGRAVPWHQGPWLGGGTEQSGNQPLQLGWKPRCLASCLAIRAF